MVGEEPALFWLGVVTQTFVKATARHTVHGKNIEVGDEYIIVRWLERDTNTSDHYVLSDVYDVIWESWSILPVKNIGRYNCGVVNDDHMHGPRRKSKKSKDARLDARRAKRNPFLLLARSKKALETLGRINM